MKCIIAAAGVSCKTGRMGVTKDEQQTLSMFKTQSEGLLRSRGAKARRQGSKGRRMLLGRHHARKHGAVQGGGRPDVVQRHTLVWVGFGKRQERPS